MILTVLPGPYSRRITFDDELSLRWSSSSYHFHLEQQAWFRVCVVPLVPIIFRLTIHLTRCHHRLITPSWNLSTICRDRQTTFWFLPEYQPNGWWQVTILVPRWSVLSPTTLLPSLQHKLVRVLCYTWRPVLFSNYSSLPWSITIFYVKNVVRILPPLKNSWYRWYFLPYPFIPWSPCCS